MCILKLFWKSVKTFGLWWPSSVTNMKFKSNYCWLLICYSGLIRLSLVFVYVGTTRVTMEDSQSSWKTMGDGDDCFKIQKNCCYQGIHCNFGGKSMEESVWSIAEIYNTYFKVCGGFSSLYQVKFKKICMLNPEWCLAPQWLRPVILTQTGDWDMLSMTFLSEWSSLMVWGDSSSSSLYCALIL